MKKRDSKAHNITHKILFGHQKIPEILDGVTSRYFHLE